MSKTKHSFTNQSYQKNFNTCRLEILVSKVYDCNYLMFQNPLDNSGSSKWIYAFITDYKYINENCCEITFEVDVIQTWFFRMELGVQFVEREHVMSDNIGENLQPESFNLGEYTFSENLSSLNEMNNNDTIAAFTLVGSGGGDLPAVGLYDNILCGAYYYLSKHSDGDRITQFVRMINNFKAHPDSVINMWCVPSFLTANLTRGERANFTNIIEDGQISANLTKTPSKITTNATFEGYKPHNHKLYSYPYNFLHVNNGNGESMSLPYEQFEGLQPQLLFQGTFNFPVKVICRPQNYKHRSTDNTQTLSIQNFPAVTWSSGAYDYWVGTQGSPGMSNAFLKAGTTAVLGAVSGGALGIGALAGASVGATASLASSISSLVSEGTQASYQADICNGSGNFGNVGISHKNNKFYWGRCHIRKHMAQAIDHFFDCFGYAVNKHKVPNINGRKQWNFVKTNECAIKGDIPTPDLKTINNCFDNGITFWKNGDNLGNYNLDNTL